MDLRIGTVSDVSGRTVRVHFEDVDIISGWLPVVYRPPYIPRTGTTSGGSGEASFASHSHEISVSDWIPSVGEKVLCIYGDGFSADGYVLGAIR